MARRLESEIEDVRDWYLERLQPPSGKQIALTVTMLDGRGWQKPLPTDPKELAAEVAFRKQVKRDWRDGLSQYPADLVQKAYNNWLLRPSRNAPYATGDLMQSVSAEFVRRKSLYMKAKSVLELIA